MLEYSIIQILYMGNCCANLNIDMCICITDDYQYTENSSRNSERNASECLKDLKDMYIDTYCRLKYSTTLYLATRKSNISFIRSHTIFL